MRACQKLKTQPLGVLCAVETGEETRTQKKALGSRGRYLLGAVLLLWMAGCSHLRMAHYPVEKALPVSNASLWQELAALRSGDWFHLLNTGSEGLEWRLRMIDSAHVSLDMETFLWKPDESGQRILAHLLAAADRGVRVRCLLDDSFTMHEGLELHALDRHPNISVRLYNPFRHRPDNGILRQLFNLGEFTRINHRMHNKVQVVDGRVALVGGRNLANEYFGMHENTNFRDMEVVAAGEAVAGVMGHFDGFWNSGWAFSIDELLKVPKEIRELEGLRADLAPFRMPPASLHPEGLLIAWQQIARSAFTGEAQFFYDRPAPREIRGAEHDADELAKVLEDLIDQAESEVILITAYLVPTPELEKIVERVERRGVKVRILTNSLRSNNHLAAHAAYRGHLHRLIRHGVDLHEVRASAFDRPLYMEAPVHAKELGLHAKLLLIDDDLAYIGSCNLDPRSLKINTEVGLVIRSPELNRALRQQLDIDFEMRNAWKVHLNAQGQMRWQGHDQVLEHQPADSSLHRLEDWFMGLLPIDGQM